MKYAVDIKQLSKTKVFLYNRPKPWDCVALMFSVTEERR